jgi:hypothetical protein
MEILGIIISVLLLLFKLIELPGEIVESKRLHEQIRQQKEWLRHNPPAPKPKIGSREMSEYDKSDRLFGIILIVAFCIIVISLILIFLI